MPALRETFLTGVLLAVRRERDRLLADQQTLYKYAPLRSPAWDSLDAAKQQNALWQAIFKAREDLRQLKVKLLSAAPPSATVCLHASSPLESSSLLSLTLSYAPPRADLHLHAVADGIDERQGDLAVHQGGDVQLRSEDDGSVGAFFYY